jgi:hypothetical protein
MDNKPKQKREIRLLPVGEKCRDFTFDDPLEELKLRFVRQKLEDMLNDNMRPLPTMICEMEDPEFLELIRPFVMFANMQPFTYREVTPATREELERKKIKSYGQLYCLIFPN